MRPLPLVFVLFLALTMGCLNSPNTPPSIDDAFPAPSTIETVPYSTIEFSISASDPEDDVTYRWYVDDNLEGAGATFSYQFDSEGAHIVRGVADDGTESVARIWEVGVTIDHDALRETVASIRSLDFSKDIPFKKITREELTQNVNEEFERRAEEICLTQRILHAFNVWDGSDLLSTLKSFYAGEAWGYYDSNEDAYYYVADADTPAVVKMVTMAHELTHALQDLHYGIPTLYAGASGDDEILAIECLIEGDATYVEGRYIETLGIEERAALYRYYASQELPDYDPFISSIVLYPYSNGARFVKTLVTDGGIGYLAEVYEELPESTEQILHPEAYLAGEGAVPLEATYDTTLEKMDEDTLGEGMLRLFLNQHVPMAQARNAAEGWGGDAYAYYGSEEEYILVYVTAWDTRQDALEFFDTYASAIEAWGSDYHELDRSENTLRATNDGRFVEMEISASTVTLVIRPDNVMYGQPPAGN